MTKVFFFNFYFILIFSRKNHPYFKFRLKYINRFCKFDVAADADMSSHMLSHKVTRTKIKKQNSQRYQTQKFIENFIFFLPFLFMIYGIPSTSSYTTHTWFSPKLHPLLVRTMCGLYMMTRMTSHRS